MTKEHILKELERAIVNYDIEGAREAAKKALRTGIDPILALKEGAAKGIRKVGEKFQRCEVFLPHLVMASDAMEESVKILKACIPKEKAKLIEKGVIVLGTVKGDIHDIGKSIVGAMLMATGFEVHDIGKDVSVEQFIEKAQELKADIIATSALMTTTMPAQKELIEELERRDLRDKFKVMVGGGSTSHEWAKEIGADGYGRDASEAVEVAERLLGRIKLKD